MAWHGMGMALHWRGVGFTQVYSVFIFCSLVSTSQVCAHQLVLVEVQCNAGVNFFFVIPNGRRALIVVEVWVFIFMLPRRNRFIE